MSDVKRIIAVMFKQVDLLLENGIIEMTNAREMMVKAETTKQTEEAIIKFHKAAGATEALIVVKRLLKIDKRSYGRTLPRRKRKNARKKNSKRKSKS